MESLLLDTPDGIGARLGWDPKLTEHDRKRILAKQLIAARMHVDEKQVVVQREAPAQFGFHTQLFAEIDGQELPLEIRTASMRGATVCAIAAEGVQIGLDLRDLTPDELELSDMQRHSHIFDKENVASLVEHWTRVQAVREADGRGARVKPEFVRLDPTKHRGWIPDRPVHYTLLDLSRDGWVVTLAYSNDA